MSKNKKIYAILNLAFKIIIGLGSIAYVYYLLFFQKTEFIDEKTGEKAVLRLSDLFDHLLDIFDKHPQSVVLFILVLLLMLVNWGVEVLKWKQLMSKIYPTNFKIAIQSILAGAAGSNFTPFKVGNFFARVALVPHKFRTKGILTLFVGDAAQFLMTMFLGSASAAIIVYGMKQSLSMQPFQDYSLSLVAISTLIVTSTLIVAFIFLKHLTFFIENLPFLGYWKKVWAVVGDFNHRNNALKLLLLSGIRLITISVQYYLVFVIFGMDISYFESFLITNTLFLIYNFLPTLNILEFGLTKSAIFIILLEVFLGKEFVTLDVALTVACTSFLIWLINLAIPSTIGSFFLLKVKLFKEE